MGKIRQPLDGQTLGDTGKKKLLFNRTKPLAEPGSGRGLGVIGKRREQDKRLTIGKESLNFIIIHV